MFENAKKLLECIQKYNKHDKNDLTDCLFEMAKKTQLEIENISGAIEKIEEIIKAHGWNSQPCMALRIAIEQAENWLETYEENEKAIKKQ